MHIRDFYAIWPPSRYSPLQFSSQLGSQLGVPLYNVGISHSSNLYRFAILVLMSYLNDRSNSDTFEYLGQFYQQAQKCIDSCSVLEVVYASYVVAVYSLIGGVSIEMAIDNCHQFCRSFVALRPWMIDDDELLWLETLWQKVLSSLYYVHRDSILFNGIGEPLGSMESIEHLQQLLHRSSSLLPPKEDISELRLSMTTEWICQKVISLSVYMQFYLDHFLFRVTFKAGAEGTRSLRAGLRDILGRIIQLIIHVSSIRDYIHNAYSIQSELLVDSSYDGPTNDFLYFSDVQPRGLKSADPKERDTALALLYTFARLIKNMLEPAADFDEKATTDIHHSTIALCRLCASFPTCSFNTPIVTLLVKRSLFWAGMILTKSRFLQGKAP